MKTPRVFALLILVLAQLAGCASTPPTAAPTPTALRQQVIDTERGFAQTMAKRDFAAFQSYLASDTVFFAGSKALRGRQAVADEWQRFYEGAEAPFSWEPREVEVLDGGTLALSSGPVRDPAGKIVAVFFSIWRLEDGHWKIVFDKGSKYCP